VAKVNKFILEKDPGINQLQDVIEDMTHFIHQNNIDVVVVGGSGAQPVAVEVRKHWQRLFSKEPMPKFIALGRLHSSLSGSDVDQIEQLVLSRSRTIKDKKLKNCFILDEFVSGGTVMSKIKQAVKVVGFKNVLAGSLLVHDMSSHHAKNLDFVGALSRTKPRFDGQRRNLINICLKHRTLGSIKNNRADLLKKLKYCCRRLK
jgi:hypoxanthine-guanine phosphoribosyltransferase